MTQEEKDLLFKDLCARLPYGLFCQTDDGKGKLISVECSAGEDLVYVDFGHPEAEEYDLNEEDIKPYLRPMSSMTVEERDEIKEICADYLDEWENAETVIDRWKLDAKTSYSKSAFYNSHHLDWNGLIEKGLALEAPEGIYKI
jgi:hypothetical protein